MFNIFNECYEAEVMVKKYGVPECEALEELRVPEKIFTHYMKTRKVEPQSVADKLLFLPRPIHPDDFLYIAKLEHEGYRTIYEAAVALGITPEEYLRYYNTIANARELPVRSNSNKTNEKEMLPKQPEQPEEDYPRDKLGVRVVPKRQAEVKATDSKVDAWWKTYKKNKK